MYLETIFRLVMAPLVVEEGHSLVITAKYHQCHLNFGSWLHHNQQNIFFSFGKYLGGKFKQTNLGRTLRCGFYNII